MRSVPSVSLDFSSHSDSHETHVGGFTMTDSAAGVGIIGEVAVGASVVGGAVARGCGTLSCPMRARDSTAGPRDGAWGSRYPAQHGRSARSAALALMAAAGWASAL